MEAGGNFGLKFDTRFPTLLNSTSAYDICNGCLKHVTFLSIFSDFYAV